MSGFQQLASSTIPKCRERREAGRAGREENGKERRAKYQTTIIDLLLLCSGSCTLIQSARIRMFRIDVIRQFRVKVGGRSRFSPMRIVLVSIPLYSLLYSSPPGVEMGNPRNIWARVSTPASGRRREHLRRRGQLYEAE